MTNAVQIIRELENKHLNSDLPDVEVGDTVDVHLRIIEGAKERIQVFNGVVIAITGSGMNTMLTVRRIVANEGVERVIPLHSPRVAKIEVKRSGHTRRAKLFYLRERVGKKRRLRDRRRGLQRKVQVPGEERMPAEEPTPVATEAEATE